MTTVKLRIRVGVTADGEWIATGASIEGWGDVERAIDETHREHGHGEPVAWYWVEAEVPRPVTVDETVEGTVTP